MIFLAQNYYTANFISIIIIYILQTSFVIDGSKHPENGNLRAASNVLNDGNNKYPYNYSRRGRGNIDSKSEQDDGNKGENDNKKRQRYIRHYDGSYRRYKGNSKRYFGNSKSHDGNNIRNNGNNKRYESNNRRNNVKNRRYDGKNRRYDGNSKSHDGNRKRYNGKSKRYDGNIRYYDGNNRRYDGNILRGDFAPPQSGANGALDVTESYADLIKKLTTERTDSKYSDRTTIKSHRKRTTPFRVSLEEDCDYLAYYCLKAYKTGPVCGRTLYYNYQNFKNYCMLDYVNCMERYEVWQIVHMGDCINITISKDYQHYEYQDDFFLDQVYVIQE